MKFGDFEQTTAPSTTAEVTPSKTSGVVNLSKGQKISLEKSMTSALIGLGWEEKDASGRDIDLDASVFMLDSNGKCRAENFVFYNNPDDPAKSVHHTGDDRKGGTGANDNEQIQINLMKIPADIEKVVVVVTIYQAEENNQVFGSVRGAYIRLLDETSKTELMFNLADEYDRQTAVVMAEIYRHNGNWKFNPVGAGYDGGLAAMCNSFGLQTE